MLKTPLFDTHVAMGARMVPFGSWEMPLQYKGILSEVRAVRTTAGIFDVSHMGRIEIIGDDAAILLSRVFGSNISGLEVSRAVYGVLCDYKGGIIDDAILYRIDNDRFLLVTNAANTDSIFEWITSSRITENQVDIQVLTKKLAMIAVQGPRSMEIVAEVLKDSLSGIRPFGTIMVSLRGTEALIARTGYTGEIGFEVILSSEVATEFWNSLFTMGAIPCGLGARDVLRLEAGLLLHGSDMDVNVNPFEAGLQKFVNPDRVDYPAGEALRTIREAGTGRKLVGFRMLGRGIPRPGYDIRDGSVLIGKVTSGSVSPTLDINIGLGYVPSSFSSPGTSLRIGIRGRPVDAEVVTLPFYSRRKSV